MSDWTKVEKEKIDSTKVDRTDVGWLVNGWLIFGWLLSSLWGIVNKTLENWDKIVKE